MIDVYSFDEMSDYGDFQIIPFELVHDVPNTGYKVHINDWKCIYATDTNQINTDAKNYDVYLIESNYDEDTIQDRIDKKIIDGLDYIYDYKVMKNHLSKQKADDFIYKNIGLKGTYIYMHEHSQEVENGIQRQETKRVPTKLQKEAPGENQEDWGKKFVG